MKLAPEILKRLGGDCANIFASAKDVEVTNDIKYVGVDDHKVDLFEGQYPVPNGIAYNSYVILDEKITVVDTVDQHFKDEWLDNIAEVLDGKEPYYLLIHHMEPDHSANIDAFLKAYPKAIVISSAMAFDMMKNYFGDDYANRRLVVKEGDTLSLGEHTLAFVEAPMVHWPEVIVSYDVKDKVLFSADGFGKFGALDADEEWVHEARRYLIGIVGKFGEPVQALLKKATDLKLEINAICPTHGPILKENLGYYLDLYNTWSSYAVEEEGIVVAYTSVYGHTKAAVEKFAQKLRDKGCPNVVVYDLARCDMTQAVSDAFRFSKIVLATTTYNGDIFPFMNTFIHHLTGRNFQKRTVAMIENGTWCPTAINVMKDLLAECKDLNYTKNNVTINAALNTESEAQLEALANELCREYMAQCDELANKNDMSALFNIGYGLYVITAKDGDKDNGMIGNAVTQVTNTPNRIAVTINKANHTHDMIAKTGAMNVNCLSVEAPFSVFQHFGFQSGRDVDKFADCTPLRSGNGIAYLPKYINAMMSLKVDQTIDLGTHSMFICSVEEARTFSDAETMTYTYYQKNVKPKPQPKAKGYVCKVCGYIYEGDVLPDDFICPWCKHGVEDFEPIV